MEQQTEQQADQAPSVLRLINSANKRLEHLLHHLDSESDAQQQLLALATTVMDAVELNPDIALACILLNQGAAEYTVRHCVDTAVVSILLARTLDSSSGEILIITAAALTMNVGMLQRQEQLQSSQTALSNQDFEFIRAHPQRSVAALTAAGIDDSDWLSYVLLHHENEDGSGYPLGKTGDDIPLSAKIISLADRYCAMVSSRNYRRSMLPDAALSDILLASSAGIDPMLTTSFIRELGIYPTGVFVRLANGEIGVVTGRGESTGTPIVHALTSADSATLAAPVRRDTADAAYAIQEMLSEAQAAAHVDMEQLWGSQASL